MMNSEAATMRKKQSFCDKRESCSLADRISGLPDDILVFILSSLTVEEAVATSILSTRWHQKQLWKLVSRLNFDCTKARRKCFVGFYQYPDGKRKFVEWVTWVLRLNNCFPLDELKIRFSLTNDFSQDIDEWIDVAISKRVRKLELNLSSQGFYFHGKRYTFPSRLLDLPFTSDRGGLLPFKFLETLYLSSVEVTGNDLHYFINHCPVLERLSVCASPSLRCLLVLGFAIPLKYLEIASCVKIETIEICNTNLISFSYCGPKIKLLVVNVPHLVELSYKGGTAEGLHHFLNHVSSYLPQVRALTWSFYYRLMRTLEFGAHPKLVKLNKLVLNIFIGQDDESLLGYVSLIEASPHLERFVLKLEWETHPTINGDEGRRGVKCSHKYLKEVEMAGYYGGTSDFELAMYFIENAVALDKIIIDPRIQYFHSPWILRSPESIEREESAGRSRAYQQLLGEVPSGVKLVLL